MATVATATVMISVSAQIGGNSFRTCSGCSSADCRKSRMTACSRTGSTVRAVARALGLYAEPLGLADGRGVGLVAREPTIDVGIT
jgi:hypothetical protein